MTYTTDDQPEQAKSSERGATGEPASHPGAASLQDKAAINAGFTGDKVAGLDLAASPLGTDDEAGGTSAAMEPTAAHAPMAQPSGTAARDPNRANAVKPPVPWLWIVVAVLAALVLGWVLLSALT
jgi:hypothetical protein